MGPEPAGPRFPEAAGGPAHDRRGDACAAGAGHERSRGAQSAAVATGTPLLNGHRRDLAHAAAVPATRKPGRWPGTPLLARPSGGPLSRSRWRPSRCPGAPGRPGMAVDPVQPAGSLRVSARCAPTAPASAPTPRRSPPSPAPAAREPHLLPAAGGRDARAAGAGRRAHLAFGANRYFDLINVSEAVAHETAAWVLRSPGPGDRPAPRRSAAAVARSATRSTWPGARSPPASPR